MILDARLTKKSSTKAKHDVNKSTGISSKGRTAVFGAVNEGSNPSIPAILESEAPDEGAFFV